MYILGTMSCRADRDHEQARRPVVDLPDQQAAADVERDVQRGLVGLNVTSYDATVRADVTPGR
jgi:hypothetical protein